MMGNRIKNRIPLKDYLTFGGGVGIIVVFSFIMVWMTLSVNGCLA